MTAFLLEWGNLLLRWAHLVVGVGWIGTSFYFVWLDLSLRRREGMRAGVAGTSWSVHGGGFYHVEKYTVAPEELPADLHWFRWEAYLTWLTGFALLIVHYYLNASVYLIDPSKADLSAWQAAGLSVASLAAGWIAYDLLCRSPIGRSPAALATAVFALVVGFAALYTSVYSGRGAFLHAGALVGTIMSANVFLAIIPNQRKMTAAMMRGETPDAELGRIGRQRSLHNNYLTLPVLVLMVSNHYPMLHSHPHGWLVVALIMVMGGAVRHFINRHDAGESARLYDWTLPMAAAALVAAIALTAPRASAPAAGGQVADSEIASLLSTHCTGCHASEPANEGFSSPPAGVTLETLQDLRGHAERVTAQAVRSTAMPPGNVTGMTAEERARLGAWLAESRGPMRPRTP